MTHFAETVKALRQERDMTMQTLADKASVSKSMICKIERDEVQPTLDVAGRIARAFNKTLSEMLHDPHASSVIFLPRNQQATWEDPNHIKRRNISPVFEGLKLEWLQVELPAFSSVQQCVAINVPGVEKYMLVVEGCLEVHVNNEIFTLQKGDSLYFDSSCSHQYFNRFNETVEMYVLVKY